MILTCMHAGPTPRTGPCTKPNIDSNKGHGDQSGRIRNNENNDHPYNIL